MARKINRQSIKRKLSQVTLRGRNRRILDNYAQNILEINKEAMLEDFDGHTIIREIKRGPKTNSDFLTQGNLFSFFGFHKEDPDPTLLLRQLIKEDTRIVRSEKLKGSMGKRYFIGLPSEKEIRDVTSDPKERGFSWALAIERSGLLSIGRYLYQSIAPRKLRPFIRERSRSGEAIQIKKTRAKNKTRVKGRRDFLTGIFERFRERVRRFSRDSNRQT